MEQEKYKNVIFENFFQSLRFLALASVFDGYLRLASLI